MRNLVYILLAVVASSLLLTNCGGDRAAERQLHEADTVMNSDPDSALSILTSMETGGLSEEQRVRHGLMLTKASDKSYKSLDNDTLISAAVEYYAGRGDSLEVQSLFYQGYYYSEKRINDKALVTLHEAYEKAVASGDEFYAGMSAREMSTVYRRLLMVKEALKWARMAKSHFLAAGKTMHTAWINNTIANDMIFSGDFRGAEELLDSIERGPYFDNVYMRINSMVNRIELELERHNYDEMLTLYDSLLRVYSEKYEVSAHDRLNQANASIMTGDAAAGEDYLTLARQMPMKESDSLYAAKLQAELFALRKDYRNAYEASRIFSDSIMKSDARRLLNPEMLLLTENYKLKADLRQIQLFQRNLFIIGLMIACGVLIAFIIRGYRYYLTRQERYEQLIASSEILKEDLSFSGLKLKEVEDENRFLRKIIDDLEVEKNASSIGQEKLMALEDENRSLKNDIEKNIMDFKEETRALFSGQLKIFEDMCELWYKNRDNGESPQRLYKGFATLIDEIGNDKKFNELTATIDRHYDNWATRFRQHYCDMSDEEYKFAVYTFLDFRSETITALLKRQSPTSVYMSRHRLKKKLIKNPSEEGNRLLAKLPSKGTKSADTQ